MLGAFLVFLLLSVTKYTQGGVLKGKSTCTELKFIFVDFDETITKHSTALPYYKASREYRDGDTDAKTKLHKIWSDLLEMYIDKYKTLLYSALSDKPSDMFNEKGLRSFLKSFSKLHLLVIKTAEATGILAGIDEKGLEEVAKSVKVYDYSINLLQRMVPRVRIVSLNWSKYLIYNCLQGAIPETDIFANSLLINGTSTGAIIKSMTNAFDKEGFVLEKVRSSKFEGLTIFVGDSPNDFLAMLIADIGIIVGNQTTSGKIAMQYGIKLKPLASYERVQKDKNLRKKIVTKILFEANSWKEIEDFLSCP